MSPVAATGDQSDDEPGTERRLVAGRYRLRDELGSGSMGTVWAGYDEFLHRPVAVKGIKLPPGFPASQAEEQRERALREARAIASLSHPNVITLYDVVREDGEPFVVMELLTARSLAGLIADNGPLSLAQAAEVGDAVAAALEAAHAAGITHRDVKPGNVLVSRDGRIKLTDFGIARNVSDMTLTKSGLMLGSPAYMAPELASGKKVSPAADLWGLGATLFTALEGDPPYDADGDPLATASEVVHGDVPEPSPGPLATLISGLMSKDPARRPDLAEVRDALFDLRPQPGRPLFEPALFDTDPDAERDNALAGASTDTEVAREPTSTGGTAPLAADPGPLPFAADAQRHERHRSVRLALFAALTVVAFLVAGAGGFALTRTLAGTNVLPASSEQQLGDGSTAIGPLVTQRGNATVLNGDYAGQFQIDAPAGWTKFVTQQQAGTLPASTLVQWVSASGHLMIGVERFPEFFPRNDADDYINGLRSFWPADGFVLVDRAEGTTLDGPLDATYRTIETQTSPEPSTSTSGQPATKVIGRTTYARMSRAGSSLWVVRVTVPTEQESRGKTELFDRIVPTFDIG
ncbi:MAG: protein kinase [Actinophytocola sp.]|nr:protein kinase [Actinophytocola sp.]